MAVLAPHSNDGHKGSIRRDKEVCPHFVFLPDVLVCVDLTFQSLDSPFCLPASPPDSLACEKKSKNGRLLSIVLVFGRSKQ